MSEVVLGRTGIRVNKNGFGALPIQRISLYNAVELIHKAYAGGITFFDTARSYTDSEEKLGVALKEIRSKVFIASKTPAKTAIEFWKDLKISLHLLQTDYIDIYQFHNPEFCPRPNDGSGLYEAMIKAKEQGKIRFIGISNHRLAVGQEAIESGLYDTLQFPFSYLAGGAELELVTACKNNNVGFIAMKALAGGLITHSAAAYAYLAQFEQVLPIWGIQREQELEEFLSYVHQAPQLTQELQALIKEDKKLLSGSFCRGCGYCMPCPVGIEINTCARMSLLLRRAPSEMHLTESTQEKMQKIKDCLHCGKCKMKCPYGLDTPKLLEDNYLDYQEILAGKKI